MSLVDYLAKNYLNAERSKPEKKSKKRKRKENGLIIADDDALGWNPDGSGRALDEDAPLTGIIPHAPFFPHTSAPPEPGLAKCRATS